MDLLGFSNHITDARNGLRLSQGLPTWALGIFLTCSSQMAYTNVVHPTSHYPTRLSLTWPLIVHYLLSSFITDYLLRKEHYAETSTQMKQSENGMKFAGPIHDIGCPCSNVISNEKMVKYFKQPPPTPYVRLVNHLQRLVASTHL